VTVDGHSAGRGRNRIGDRTGDRARRGVAALPATLFLLGVLASLLGLWQIAQAQERVRGEARHLADVLAAEAYALHHWLHAARQSGSVTTPAIGTARALTPTEQLTLSTHSATAPWRRSSGNALRTVMPRGWSLTALIGTTGEDIAVTDLIPDGVLILRPDDATVNGPRWPALTEALDVLLRDASPRAGTLANTAITTFDATRDHAVLASRFARLDRDAVLRQTHAGHPLRPAQTDLALGNRDLTNTNALQADSAVAPAITGNCRPGSPSNPLCAENLDGAADLSVTGVTRTDSVAVTALTTNRDVTGVPIWRTDTTVIDTATTATRNLTACADTEADRCGGGDLDLVAATGTPDWTDAAIFGDVIIRDGNRLVGITDTFVRPSATDPANAFFEDLTAQTLSVRGCLRVVNPFVFGAGC